MKRGRANSIFSYPNKLKIVFRKLKMWLKTRWMWKHKQFLYFILVVAIILLVVYFKFEFDTKFESIIISIATGLLASSIIAWYSELKSYTLSELEDLLFEIDFFDRDVKSLYQRTYNNIPIKRIAELYYDLLTKQSELSEKYYNNKYLIEPIPSLGDHEAVETPDIIQEKIAMVWERDCFTKEFSEEFMETIRNSLTIMERQNRYCMSYVKDLIKLSKKIL